MLRAALLTSLAVLLLGAASTTAQAQDNGRYQVFSKLGCGTLTAEE
jgi:hypothetical protein